MFNSFCFSQAQHDVFKVQVNHCLACMGSFRSFLVQARRLGINSTTLILFLPSQFTLLGKYGSKEVWKCRATFNKEKNIYKYNTKTKFDWLLIEVNLMWKQKNRKIMTTMQNIIHCYCRYYKEDFKDKNNLAFNQVKKWCPKNNFKNGGYLKMFSVFKNQNQQALVWKSCVAYGLDLLWATRRHVQYSEVKNNLAYKEEYSCQGGDGDNIKVEGTMTTTIVRARTWRQTTIRTMRTMRMIPCLKRGQRAREARKLKN